MSVSFYVFTVVLGLFRFLLVAKIAKMCASIEDRSEATSEAKIPECVSGVEDGDQSATDHAATGSSNFRYNKTTTNYSNGDKLQCKHLLPLCKVPTTPITVALNPAQTRCVCVFGWFHIESFHLPLEVRLAA